MWRDGGPFYGVPLSNFFGWLLTVYIFYQLFALYLRSRPTQSASKRHWRLAILFYGVSALGNLLIAVPASLNGVFVDATGRSWIVSSILWASRLISIFLMMPLAVLAWIRAPGFGGARLAPARPDIKDV
ncbi:MAG: carotenoid biosynthesis protein [Chthoniobacterales bacterium]